MLPRLVVLDTILILFRRGYGKIHLLNNQGNLNIGIFDNVKGKFVCMCVPMCEREILALWLHFKKEFLTLYIFICTYVWNDKISGIDFKLNRLCVYIWEVGEMNEMRLAIR